MLSAYAEFLVTSYQVQWDEAAALQRPESVSPWEIEPFDVSVSLSESYPTPMKTKRNRPSIELPISGMFMNFCLL